jgi:dTDP-4-amino-4,6-dideoxygalactose transaminase
MSPPPVSTATARAALAPAPPALRPVVPYQRPAPPSLAEVARYYALSEEARHFSNGGPCVRLLAERTAERVGGGVRALPMASGTSALLVALRAAFGAPEGARRRVVVPSFTFTATACAVVWAGFEPLFCDVDPVAWQVDPADLARILGEQGDRVAGVLATSTFGTPAPAATRRAWAATCEAHGVPLVLDSAAAFGAVDDEGRPCGADGLTHVFSFHVTKPFAVAEGGLVTTGDPGLAERMAELERFGMPRPGAPSAVAGLNAKLSELHAASALAMLDRYDEVLAVRRGHVAAIAGLVAGTRAAFQAGSAGSTWQVLQVACPSGRARDAALRAARAEGVEARTCFDPPLHRHPAFADCPVAGDLRTTARVAARALSLPMANDLSAQERARIAEVVLRSCA